MTATTAIIIALIVVGIPTLAIVGFFALYFVAMRGFIKQVRDDWKEL